MPASPYPCPPSPWRGWAIYHPAGGIFPWTIGQTRAQAVSDFVHGQEGAVRTWRRLYQEGYRARRIEIREMR